MQPRESRREVVIPAQMRSKKGWSDVTIRNISPYGMMLLAPFPPKPGTHVEVRRASLVLIGRVIWVKGKALGIQLIERLNFNAFLRAANEGWAANQNDPPHVADQIVPAGIPAHTLVFDEVRAPVSRWLLAGAAILLAGACAAATLWQI